MGSTRMDVVVHHRSRPKVGEVANGDAVLVQRWPEADRLVVIDGLGHGQAASDASRTAVTALEAMGPEVQVDVLFDRLGRALRGGRGIALTLLERRGASLTAAGVGNVALRLTGSGTLPFISTPGILGGTVRRLRVAEGSVDGPLRAVLHSDGVSSRFQLESVSEGTPESVALRLMTEHAHDHDDASVLVVDFRPDAPPTS
jgi:phosphoserine phosphatase RsbX